MMRHARIPSASRPIAVGAPISLRTLIVLAALAAFLAGCSDLFQTAGGTSDTDNAVKASVTGELRNPDGTVAAGRAVLARKDGYLSPFPGLGKHGGHEGHRKGYRSMADLTTDSLGRFRIDSLDTGDYLIEARDGEALGTLYRATVKPGKTSPIGAAVGKSRLAATAELQGTVLFRAGAFRAYVQVYGMERRVAVDSAGRFALRLPAGSYTLRYVDPEQGGNAKTGEVTVAEGQKLVLDTVSLGDPASPYAAWRHSAEIEINTTAVAGGAGIKSGVSGFPLLVRLDATNFDFAQARPDGRDLRFAKPDGDSALPFEIERWDAATRRAEVWVRLDTILPDLRFQHFHMYWGNPDATPGSDGPSVFGGNARNAAVWHLGDDYSKAEGSYRDASGNGNHGTGSGMEDTCLAEGLIGRAQSIDGDIQHIGVADAPSLALGSGDLTLSAWVWAAALTGTHQIFSKRTSPGRDYEIQVMSTGRVAGYADPLGPADGYQSKGSLTAGAWHHVAFKRQENILYHYLDGVLDDSSSVALGDLDNSGDLWIGQDVSKGTEPWKGYLDEIRVSAKAATADWIKLNFASQAKGSRMLSLRRFP